LCEGNAGPSDGYLVVLKYLYKYLETTKSIGLLLGGKYKMDNLGLKTYGDASFADDLLIRYSTGAYVVFLMGGPVFWKTKKQTFVATSTTEAEFCNLTLTAQLALWVAEIIREFGYP